MAATGYSSFSLEKTTFICVSVHPSEQNLEQLKTPTNNSFYIDLQSLSLTNWVTHSESSMIVLGKQVGEVWKIPRILRILGISKLLLPVYPGLYQTLEKQTTDDKG